MVTLDPVVMLPRYALPIVMVTVSPVSLAPATTSVLVTVPLPEFARPDVGLVYVKVVADGTEATVKVPL